MQAVPLTAFRERNNYAGRRFLASAMRIGEALSLNQKGGHVIVGRLSQFSLPFSADSLARPGVN